MRGGQLAALQALQDEQARTHLSIRNRGNLERLPIDEVLYFRAEQKYVVARYRDGEALLDESLKSLEEEFGERFVRIHRNALVMHPAPDMFALVNDVRAYPQFLPWCSRANVLEENPAMMRARLEIAKGTLRQSFTTRNVLAEPAMIEMQLEDGPFSFFRGCWQFTALNDYACKVALDLEFGNRAADAEGDQRTRMGVDNGFDPRIPLIDLAVEGVLRGWRSRGVIAAILLHPDDVRRPQVALVEA